MKNSKIESLYRGINLENEWVYGVLYKGINGRCWITNSEDIDLDSHQLNWIEVSPDTVSMWTEINDDNGVKIFEGDIIKYLDEYTNKYKKDFISWNDDNTCFVATKNDCDFYATHLFSKPLGGFYDESDPVFVIGNVFQNADTMPKYLKELL